MTYFSEILAILLNAVVDVLLGLVVGDLEVVEGDALPALQLV
jgi:hypothetical protein